MHSRLSFRPLFVLFLLALLFAPWSVEARPSVTPRTAAPASPSIADYFIGWFMALWGDNGCTMDASGSGCRESLDNGCTADPNGSGCQESPEVVCGWDPNGGRCRDNG